MPDNPELEMRRRGFRGLLGRHGLDPIHEVFLTVIHDRFLGSEFEDKRGFIEDLVSRDTDIHWVLAADAALDMEAMFLQGRASQDCSDLVAAAIAALDGRLMATPPPELIQLVSGNSDLSAFNTSGRESTADILGALVRNGLSLEDMPSVLDFGCGCGRVLRNLAPLYKEVRWHGCDANATPL